MRDAVRAASGLAAALVVHTLLSKAVPSWTPLFHVFLLVVLFAALLRGELFGAIMGTCCGLVVDTLSLGVFGLAGLSMTLIGYLAGLAAKRINVLSFFRNFLFLFIMTALEFILWNLLTGLLVGQPLASARLLVARPLATSLLGTLVFGAFRRIQKRHGR
jgi:rod shape-determining protein MreD